MSDAWLPRGYELSQGAHLSAVAAEGDGWQIWDVREGSKVLLAEPALAADWRDRKLVAPSDLGEVLFGDRQLVVIEGGANHRLERIGACASPQNKLEAIAFAHSLSASRALDRDASFAGAIYVERISRLLPTGSSLETGDDSLVLGGWLSGGPQVDAAKIEILPNVLSWLSPFEFNEILAAAGMGSSLRMPEFLGPQDGLTQSVPGSSARTEPRGRFSLPGRPSLETFFNDHVVDIVENPQQYAALGISFPGAMILEGPPGTGKTFAIEKLVAFLGWPSFSIEASSVASPYIHETSRKVADVFRQAKESAPSVIVIDEMEAFLSERDGVGGPHRVEEVAEFLRRIPEAVAARVLVIGMTNKIEMIDSAIRRRGRFDHIVHVGPASEQEVRALLVALLEPVPTADDVDVDSLAAELAGRPLSDVAYVVREGCRIAAKARQPKVAQDSLLAALSAAKSRPGDSDSRRIGFI
ncbi:ATP-binding protein [Rhodoblastus sp.]|uniref:ATP-binding protein n=1 Tax=Rhodoblastus sp. TaxID=1962975 RepID=UPI0035B07735